MNELSLITVLYLDDEEPNVFLFKATFRTKVNVVTANTGSEAMRYLDNNPDISVVISDMQMPGLTGLEFIQQAHIKYPKKSYYLLTGMDDTKEINHALSSGIIKKCFKKPLDYDEILRVMKH